MPHKTWEERDIVASLLFLACEAQRAGLTEQARILRRAIEEIVEYADEYEN